MPRGSSFDEPSADTRSPAGAHVAHYMCNPSEGSLMACRRFIALGASLAALAIAGPVAPAFGDSSADQTASNGGGSQAANGSATTQGAGQSQSTGGGCTVGCGGSGQA